MKEARTNKRTTRSSWPKSRDSKLRVEARARKIAEWEETTKYEKHNKRDSKPIGQTGVPQKTAGVRGSYTWVRSKKGSLSILNDKNWEKKTMSGKTKKKTA